MRLENVSTDGRRQAAMILARVESTGAHAARLLGDVPPFVREVVLGVLRWQLTVDTLLGRHLTSSLPSLEPRLRGVLRAGAYEALRMDTPAPVAVAEAVRVAKLISAGAGRLANAVLRRVARAQWPESEDERLPLDVRYSHPAWMVNRWRALLGDARAVQVLAANQLPAPLALFAPGSDRATLEQGGVELEDSPAFPGVWFVRSGAAAAVVAVRAGRAYAMDPTAVAVAGLVPATAGPVLEVAAAPGGKSLVLSHQHPSAFRLACDRHLGRVAMLRANLRRAIRPPQILAADGTSLPFRPGTFRTVVVDAPCSGTGTLKRHPEIRWRLRESDLAGLGSLQRRLVEAALAVLPPGGILVYATCSLEPEENAQVLAGLPVEPLDVRALVPAGCPHVPVPGGGIILLPHLSGDGFTVFVGRRSA